MFSCCCPRHGVKRWIMRPSRRLIRRSAAWTRNLDYSRLRLFVLWGAVAAICALSARTALVALAGAGAPERRPPGVEDAVTEFERRLEPARALLSGNRVIGYASDIPNDRLMNIGYHEHTRRYFLAQYALAPTRLAIQGNYRWFFVDFPSEQAMREHAVRAGYAVRWNDAGRALLETLP